MIFLDLKSELLVLQCRKVLTRSNAEAATVLREKVPDDIPNKIVDSGAITESPIRYVESLLKCYCDNQVISSVAEADGRLLEPRDP